MLETLEAFLCKARNHQWRRAPLRLAASPTASAKAIVRKSAASFRHDISTLVF
jgi:hypothetical protein